MSSGSHNHSTLLYLAKYRIVSALGCLAFAVSCGGSGSTEIVSHNFSLDSVYSMYTENVDVLVSDSGRTQFRMAGLEWYIYQEENPFWYFPKGFYAEHFDDNKRKLAEVKADTAYYFTSDELWKFIGNVRVVNHQGEQFSTQQLYWNKKEARVYSDSTVRVESESRILVGSHFEASQDFKEYTFYNNAGEIEVEDLEEEQDAPQDEATSN